MERRPAASGCKTAIEEKTMADRANADEGADPSDDIRKQNPGETTTADLAEKPDDDPSRANKPEPVEDRENVGQVKPEDYPAQQ
jgi:hypothetical protein